MSPNIPLAAAGNAAAARQATSPSQAISIQCYEDEVPAFAEQALQRLYGNLFSSLAHRRVYGGIGNASTYVVRQGEDILCLWLFRLEKQQVQVLNEGITIAADEVIRFANTIFATYRSVNLISFHAVHTRMDKLRLPHQRFNCLEDMVLGLPRSAADYQAALGKSTRSYIKRYLNKLRRDFPLFQYHAYAAQEIDSRHVGRIVELNRVRMAAKGKVSINDDDTAQRMIRLARECGLVVVLVIDGNICAGTVNYRIGDNYFLDVLAHDPAYNDYRLGTLCCYLTVCECIARGAGEYHLLWGQDAYKSRLLAQPRQLDDLVVYRSRRHMLVNVNTVLKNALNACERQARLWLRNARREDGLSSRLVLGLLRGVRSLGLVRP